MLRRRRVLCLVVLASRQTSFRFLAQRQSSNGHNPDLRQSAKTTRSRTKSKLQLNLVFVETKRTLCNRKSQHVEDYHVFLASSDCDITDNRRGRSVAYLTIEPIAKNEGQFLSFALGL
ncbi:hypothetical protein DBV15_02689 [Temnothorax longispinosus]|uniref:Uncharacterized protein n=1 Tax=Temnothorax longispinosus TaxID=300112 RepID=A0A4S2K992_9HYME|nr:hypothetical protein DBV15_02689 [Temnothorax longispinosus]